MTFKCCSGLKHGLFFAKDAIYTCQNLYCMKSEEKIVSDYRGELPIAEKIIEYKKKKIQEFKEGRIPDCCLNCPECREDNWDETIAINQYTFFHYSKCSSNCNYCESMDNKALYNSFQEYKVVPILEELKKNGCLDFNGYTSFWCGEATEIAEFEDIINFFLENNQGYYHIHTSGLFYNKSIETLLKNAGAEICIVLDSSDKETFLRIKGIDKYDVVWDNIRKYNFAKKDYNLVSLKYVFSPGINDNQNQIEKWLEKVVQEGIKKVVLDLDGRYLYYNKKRMPASLPEKVTFIKNFCKENDVSIDIYGILQDFLNNIGSKYNVLQEESPDEKPYFSCEEFAHTLVFSPEGLRHCLHPGPQFSPAVIPISDEALLNPDKVFEFKEVFEEERRKGIISDFCKKCIMAKNAVHSRKRYINKVQIAHKLDCNADCSFCYNHFSERRFKPYKILPQLEQFKEYFKNGCEMLFLGGEATIWDEFEDIIDFALREDFYCITLSSNGSVFSEKLAEGIRNKKVQLIISTDVAEENAFRKLKKLDWNVVADNIKKYLECDVDNMCVSCKMNLIPFVNDTEEQIEQWIQCHADLGVKKLALDIESLNFMSHREYFHPKYKHLLDYAEKSIKEKGLECVLHSLAEQLRYDNRP